MKNRILVVDDSPITVHLLNKILEEEGHEVITASDGLIGLQKARRFLPDLVILDIMMPLMNGYEVCRRLNADPETADIDVIFLSAVGNLEASNSGKFSKVLEARSKGFDAGAIEFLGKPIGKEDLLERVNFLLWARNRLNGQNG